MSYSEKRKALNQTNHFLNMSRFVAFSWLYVFSRRHFEIPKPLYIFLKAKFKCLGYFSPYQSTFFNTTWLLQLNMITNRKKYRTFLCNIKIQRFNKKSSFWYRENIMKTFYFQPLEGKFETDSEFTYKYLLEYFCTVGS